MKKWYLTCAILLMMICVLCAMLLIRPEEGRVTETERQIQEALDMAFETDGTPLIDRTETPLYQSPIDFESLRATSPDIYAWIYIPGTTVNYPVLQHVSDDEYYLRRNSAGDYDRGGSLFTQSTYNSLDFLDPATVIYGHNLQDGGMFHPLQVIYSSPSGMAEHEEIIVYLPEEEHHYTVFAAVPYSTYHLLYNLDFSDAGIYQAFIDSIYCVRSMEAQVNQNMTVHPGDRLLILSTCLNNTFKKRYLVLAKEEY